MKCLKSFHSNSNLYSKCLFNNKTTLRFELNKFMKFNFTRRLDLKLFGKKTIDNFRKVEVKPNQENKKKEKNIEKNIDIYSLFKNFNSNFKKLLDQKSNKDDQYIINNIIAISGVSIVHYISALGITTISTDYFFYLSSYLLGTFIGKNLNLIFEDYNESSRYPEEIVSFVKNITLQNFIILFAINMIPIYPIKLLLPILFAKSTYMIMKFTQENSNKYFTVNNFLALKEVILALMFVIFAITSIGAVVFTYFYFTSNQLN